MKKGVFHKIWLSFAALCGCILLSVGYFQFSLPETYTVPKGQELTVGRWIAGQAVNVDGRAASAVVQVGEEYRADLRLMGLFPVKQVTVSVAEPHSVMVCGIPFGIKLYTDGVLVVGMSDVETAAGGVNPAAAAGVCVGDTILAINGEEVTTSRDVTRLVNACGGKAVTLHLRRDGVEFDATFTPARPAGESGYRMGMWVRDSTAGVGTLTFYDPQSGAFAGLGHAMCDADTGKVMTLSEGEIVPARIFGVHKSVAGAPGELNGCFEAGSLGELYVNGSQGLYGLLTATPQGWQTLPVAARQQVKVGTAQVLTTLDGTTPQLYDIEILQIKYGGLNATRHMVIRVTDSRLLTLAGGIVQGMSGSPIIQNGKLVGAVTHVLVDDPTRGYAIFAENMLETAQSVADEHELKEAS
ncbi:MAG: SpoIVB peptidase [Clostridia bacterium]|nr:SpoIVB peptidase [Clostridia bacterium]